MFLDDRIGGPREGLRVDSLAAYEDKVRKIRAGYGLAGALKRSSVALPAYVSDGRWVVDCPCGSGALASHEWAVAICPDCGTIHPAAFPDDREMVEAVLVARPARNRHYFPHEDTAERRGLARAERLEDLEDENVAHGYDVGRRAEQVRKRQERKGGGR